MGLITGLCLFSLVCQPSSHGVMVDSLRSPVCNQTTVMGWVVVEKALECKGDLAENLECKCANWRIETKPTPQGFQLGKSDAARLQMIGGQWQVQGGK